MKQDLERELHYVVSWKDWQGQIRPRLVTPSKDGAERMVKRQPKANQAEFIACDCPSMLAHSRCS